MNWPDIGQWCFFGRLFQRVSQSVGLKSEMDPKGHGRLDERVMAQNGTKWHQIDSNGINLKSGKNRERERDFFLSFCLIGGRTSAFWQFLPRVQERQTQLWRLRCAVSIVAPRPQGGWRCESRGLRHLNRQDALRHGNKEI